MSMLLFTSSGTLPSHEGPCSSLCAVFLRLHGLCFRSSASKWSSRKWKWELEERLWGSRFCVTCAKRIIKMPSGTSQMESHPSTISKWTFYSNNLLWKKLVMNLSLSAFPSVLKSSLRLTKVVLNLPKVPKQNQQSKHEFPGGFLWLGGRLCSMWKYQLLLVKGGKTVWECSGATTLQSSVCLCASACWLRQWEGEG